MPIINVDIKNKIASGDGTIVVCDNSDYIVHFTFDAEWANHEVKTMRVVFSNGTFYEVVFVGDECNLPIIQNKNGFEIGVYAGNLQTTVAACFDVKKSILSSGDQHGEPTEDVYNQIIEMIEDGMVKGDKGDKGDPGPKGDRGDTGRILYGVGNANDEQGHWTASIDGISEYYEGLTIVYQPMVKGGQTGYADKTELNVNGIGAKDILKNGEYVRAFNELTFSNNKTYLILLTYTVVNGFGHWETNYNGILLTDSASNDRAIKGYAITPYGAKQAAKKYHHFISIEGFGGLMKVFANIYSSSNTSFEKISDIPFATVAISGVIMTGFGLKLEPNYSTTNARLYYYSSNSPDIQTADIEKNTAITDVVTEI